MAIGMLFIHSASGSASNIAASAIIAKNKNQEVGLSIFFCDAPLNLIWLIPVLVRMSKHKTSNPNGCRRVRPYLPGTLHWSCLLFVHHDFHDSADFYRELHPVTLHAFSVVFLQHTLEDTADASRLVQEASMLTPTTPPPLAKPEMTAEDLEILAEMQQVNEQATRLISDHLDRYIKRIGSEATFEGWIGILHPENCTLDSRLTFPDSDHLRLWNEREGVRAAAADSDGGSFWKGVGSLANDVATRMSKKVAAKAKPEEGTAAALTAPSAISETSAPSLDDSFGALFARTEARGALGHSARTVSEVHVELKQTLDDLFAKRPSAPQAWSPLASGSEVADVCHGPLNASDVNTLEAARAEIGRLRRLLAQAPRAPKPEAGAQGATTEVTEHRPRPPTRLDALLRLTRVNHPTRNSSHAKVQSAASSVQTSAPSLDDSFGALFARTEARGALGHSARTVSEVDVELKKTMDDLFAKRTLQQPALEPLASPIPGALPPRGSSLSTSLLDDLFARPPAAPTSSQNPFG